MSIVVFTGKTDDSVSNGIFFRRSPLSMNEEEGGESFGVPDYGVYMNYFNYDMIFAYGGYINRQFRHCKKLKRR